MSGNLAAVWGASGNWPKRGKCRAILQCLESGHPEASVRFSGHLCECVLANCTLAFLLDILLESYILVQILWANALLVTSSEY